LNKKNKVVVFGDLPIATKIVEYVRGTDETELSAVVIGNENPNNNDPWTDTQCLAEYCKQNYIRTYSLKEFNETFEDKRFDLGLSCRFSKIIKKNTIDMFRIGIINMHGGLLPEFGGLYSANMSVLYGAKMGGGTLHWVDEGIDHGDILRRCEFPIEENDTGYSVFQKTQITLCENMIDIIPKVLNSEIKAEPIQNLKNQGHESRYFNKQSIFDCKEVTADMPQDEILRKIRAFDFPGYEPAYAFVNGKRIYLRITK
jgi:methionyl-tRNA formyltransferase